MQFSINIEKIVEALKNIPQELTAKPNWVLWARSQKNDGRIDKIPVNANTQKNAQSSNPKTWADFETACNVLKEITGKQLILGSEKKPIMAIVSGVGFMLKDSGITCIDVDHCPDAIQQYRNGEHAGIVYDVISALGTGCYAEISQSGEGVHIFVQGEKPPEGCRKGTFEMYSTGRFIAMTGDLLDDIHTHIEGDCTDALKELHGRYLQPKAERPPREKPAPVKSDCVDITAAIETALRVDPKFSQLWAGAATGYDSASQADQALCNKLAYYLHGDAVMIDAAFRQSGLYREKWERRDYRETTIETALRGTTEYFDYSMKSTQKKSRAQTRAQTRAQSTPTVTTAIRSTADGTEPPKQATALERLEALELNDFTIKYRKQGDVAIFGGVKQCNRNIKRYIAFRDILHDIRYNEFSGQPERLRSRAPEKWERVTDRDLLELITRIEKTARKETGVCSDLQAVSEWNIKKEFIADCILEGARRAHPVKELLEGLQWDGKPRISTLLPDVLGADNNSYTAAAMRATLLGVISRIYDPGTKFDYMLILQGKQGAGKSSFLKSLAIREEWYGAIGAAHVIGEGATKKLGEDAAGKLILEYEELDGIRRAAASQLKAMITRTDDQYRQAYRIYSESHPRQYVIAGTTNDAQYLSDPTGNRRFLPIPITKKGFLDRPTVLQVWAEAFAIYKSGEYDLYLSGKEEVLAENYRQNVTRLVSDDYIDDIAEYLNGRQITKVIEVYNALHDRQLGTLKQSDAEKVIRTALTALGWSTKQMKMHGINQRVWYKDKVNE